MMAKEAGAFSGEDVVTTVLCVWQQLSVAGVQATVELTASEPYTCFPP